MKTTFRLVRPNSDSDTALYLDINHSQVRKRWGTGVSIHPELWNHDKQRAIPTHYFLKKHQKENPGLQTRLDNVNNVIDDILRSTEIYKRKCEVNGNGISAVGLKGFLDREFKSSSNNSDYQFFTDYMEADYIPKLKSGDIVYVRNNKRKSYSSSTIKTKERVLNAFKAYEEDNSKIRFGEIDHSLYEKFVSWCELKRMSINYIGKLVKELKVVMRHAYKGGIHSNKYFDDDSFITFKEETPSVYLTEEELKDLYTLELEDELSHLRDVFLCGCWTALRFSDYTRLEKDHIKKDRGRYYVDIITQKTGERLLIPIKNELWDILSNRSYFQYGPISEQKLNREIKKICRKAGIDTPITFEKTIGGKRVSKRLPKYKFITTHTARRTGASLMYLAGIPIMDIQKITGHKSMESFKKYIRVTKEETASRLAIHPYFNGIQKSAS